MSETGAPTPIVPRVFFQQPFGPAPWESRPAFIGNEIESKIVLDLRTLTASGHLGAFAALPADLAQDAERYTSIPFEVQFTDADREILLALVQRAFQCAAEQGVLNVTMASTFRIDPPVP